MPGHRVKRTASSTSHQILCCSDEHLRHSIFRVINLKDHGKSWPSFGRPRGNLLVPIYSLEEFEKPTNMSETVEREVDCDHSTAVVSPCGTKEHQKRADRQPVRQRTVKLDRLLCIFAVQHSYLLCTIVGLRTVMTVNAFGTLHSVCLALKKSCKVHVTINSFKPITQI